jgi:hypothetical protein
VKVVPIPPRKINTGNAIEVLDTLRDDLLSGKIVAFVAAGVAPDDVAYAYASSTGACSRLRMMGAIGNLSYCYHEGDLE